MANKLYTNGIALPAPFIAGSCDPVDARLVVETKADLTTNAAATFGTVGDYCKVYEGIQVYVSLDKAIYAYTGPSVANNGILLSEVLKVENWTKVASKYYPINSIDNKINVTEKGAANGVATLDADGRVPASLLIRKAYGIDINKTEINTLDSIRFSDLVGNERYSELVQYTDQEIVTDLYNLITSAESFLDEDEPIYDLSPFYFSINGIMESNSSFAYFVGNLLWIEFYNLNSSILTITTIVWIDISGSKKCYVNESQYNISKFEERITDIEDNHVASKNNPHEVTKELLGLGAVDNTSDLDKPISTAAQLVLNSKANLTDLSNVLASEVVNLPALAEVDTPTRDELKRDLFNDLWTKAVYIWGSVDLAHTEDGVSKPYKCNDVWLTYDEAVYIYGVSGSVNTLGTDMSGCFNSLTSKTIIPIKGKNLINLMNAFSKSESLLIVNFDPDGAAATDIDRFDGAFSLCTNLHTIEGVLNISNATAYGDFYQCTSLLNIKIKGVTKNFSIRYSPLSYSSMQYLITNCANNNVLITITVHPDVYAKLTGDTTNEAVANTPSDELALWSSLLTTAIKKNIIFAT